MRFEPGFRISVLDTAFVLVLAAAALYSGSSGSLFAAVAFATPAVQFFLFCNVFRVRRAPELAWAALCITIFVTGRQLGASPLTLVAASGLLGALVIGLEMRHPSDHGVWWRRVNPQLPEWFEANFGK